MDDLPPNPSFAALLTLLTQRLAGALPGLHSQLLMAPRPRSSPAPGVDPHRAKPAAVLVLLFPGESSGPDESGPVASGRLVHDVVAGEPCLMLTRRTDNVGAHKGQICLPGGGIEAGEEPLAAALRECEEEIGVPRAAVKVLGRLTPLFIAVSGYRIEPFVGALDRRPEFRPQRQEVESLLEMPLRYLHDPHLRFEKTADRNGTPVVVPGFSFHGVEVWGATAMVLSELAVLLDDPGEGPARAR